MQKDTFCDTFQVTKPQAKLLDYLKEFGWGKLELTVKDGQPVKVSVIKHETMLDR